MKDTGGLTSRMTVGELVIVMATLQKRLTLSTTINRRKISTQMPVISLNQYYQNVCKYVARRSPRESVCMLPWDGRGGKTHDRWLRKACDVNNERLNGFLQGFTQQTNSVLIEDLLASIICDWPWVECNRWLDKLSVLLCSWQLRNHLSSLVK